MRAVVDALPRVVLDTNVLLSGLLSPHGVPGRIVDRVSARQLRLALDDRILAEYREVLSRPRFRIELESLRRVLAILEAQDFFPSEPWTRSLPDPDDAAFLEVAAAAEVCLITGNLKHFPKRARGPVEVLDPRAWWESQT